MATIHDGDGAPLLPQEWDPSDIDVLWVAWDNVLNGATISTSSWVRPTGWSESLTYESQTVTDEEGTTFNAANGLRTQYTGSTDDLPQTFEFENTVTLSDGRTLARSVRVRLAQQ